MDALERRDGRAQADDTQGRPDSVSRRRRREAPRSPATPTFVSARVADDAVSAGGVGAFSVVTLEKMLAGKAVRVAPFVGEINEGLQGGSTPQDLETMFQLVHLYFTQPRSDPDGVCRDCRRSRRRSWRTRARTPTSCSTGPSRRRSAETICAGSRRRRRRSISGTSPQALAFYKARFADAEQLHVRIRRQLHDRRDQAAGGNLHRQPAGDARERNVARRRHHAAVQHGSKRRSTWASRRRATSRSAVRAVRVRRVAQAGDADRHHAAAVAVVRHDPAGPRRHVQHHRDTSSRRSFPDPQYALRIEWTCDPARTDSLGAASVAGDRVRQGPGCQRSRCLVRETLLRDFERDSQDNGYLLNAIVRLRG